MTRLSDFDEIAEAMREHGGVDTETRFGARRNNPTEILENVKKDDPTERWRTNDGSALECPLCGNRERSDRDMGTHLFREHYRIIETVSINHGSD